MAAFARCQNNRNFTVVGVVACCVVVIVVVSLSLTLSSTSGNKESNNYQAQPWKEMRLPKSIMPNNYSVFLDVSVERFNYSGEVAIDVIVFNETNVVVLHKVGLDIFSTTIERLDNQETVSIERVFEFEPNEFWVIKMNKNLAVGVSYLVKLKFHGNITSDLSGFYKNKYLDQSGNERKLAVTFFSPISARKAFPCFDEPAFKSHFQLSLKHALKYTSLANMPVMSTEVTGNTTTTRFQPSLKMSTYIMCWIIFDFQYRTLITTENLTIKAWARSDKVNLVTHSLNATAILLRRLEEYFNISFPLNKLDMVAVPSFGPNAMENWGLITYRQSTMLITDNMPKNNLRKAYDTIAHELVHQWFGNLATMKFWTEVWLKEGFANFIGKSVSNEIYPELGIMSSVLPEIILPALETDCYATSNPISTKVTTPNQIREMFSAITYMKGHCVVQMLKHIMGAEAFRSGLQRYLKTYSYSNANQDDLWEQLALESGKKIKPTMDTWTLQMGYPVISTKRVNNTHVMVEQQRFSLDPPNTEPPSSPYNYTWHVPISFQDIKTNFTYEYLLTSKRAVIKVPLHSILNPGHVLYYRVNYESDDIVYFINQLQKNYLYLSMADRTGLISDQFNLFKARMANLSSVVNLINYLKNETEYAPWRVAILEMNKLQRMLDKNSAQDLKWKTLMRELIKDRAVRVGWNATNNTELQVIFLLASCKLNVSSIVKKSEDLFRAWMKGDNNLNADLKSAMMICANTHNSDVAESEEWSFLYNQYLKEKVTLDALTYTRSEVLLNRLLEDSLNTTRIRSNNAPYFVGSIAKRSRVGLDLAWNFIKKHWNVWMHRYGQDIFLLGLSLKTVLTEFASLEELEDVENFFRNKDLGSGNKALKQSILIIKFNIEWKKIINDSEWFTS